MSEDRAYRFGLPCGGTLKLLLEFQPGAGAMDALVQQLDHDDLVRRDVAMATGTAMLYPQALAAPLLDSGHTVRNVFGPQALLVRPLARRRAH